MATKQEVWLLRTVFGIAPVNKLVSLTWLLWALRSFRSFTLHYVHYYCKPLDDSFITTKMPIGLGLLIKSNTKHNIRFEKGKQRKQTSNSTPTIAYDL